jgi:uroporphyrinogen III methyltransferase / synthase
MKADVASALPLAGRVVLITRAEGQAGRFAALLEQAGARVIVAPTIVIDPPDSWSTVDAALARPMEYRWVIFTSVNGVEMVRRRLEQAGRGKETLSACRIAAIGPATAEALTTWGLPPEVVPSEYVAEDLAARLKSLVNPNDRVLLLRAAEARDVLVRELEAMGARVDEMAVYRTRAATERAAILRDALRRRAVDVVTFTSSSTVRNFAALWTSDELPSLMDGVTVACIGPVTRATASAVGLRTDVMPNDYTIPALARAIAAYFEEQRS